MSSQVLSGTRPIPAATTWDWRLACIRALALLFVLLMFSASLPAYSEGTADVIDQLKLVSPTPTLASNPALQSPTASN